MEKRVSRFTQIKVYTQKNFRVFSNEKGWKTFISAALITILISMVTGEEMFYTYQATQKGCFAVMSACIWIGIFNSIRSICRERDILKREHRTGLHMSAYVAARLCYEAVICLAEAMIVTVLIWIANWGHFIEGGVILPAIIELFFTFFLIILASDGLGMVISSVVKSENTAMTVMPFALIIQLVMSGMLLELSGVTKAVSILTISRWGLNALLSVAHVDDMTFLVPDDYVSTPGNLLFLWLLLIGFVLLYTILSIVALEFIDNDKR